MAYKTITEERFKEAKDLLFRGETIGEVVRKTGISHQTVKLIEQAKDLAEYQAIARDYWKGKKLNRQQKNIPSQNQQAPFTESQVHTNRGIETKSEWYRITIPSGLYDEVLRDIANGVEIKQALIGFIIGRARKERE